MPCCYYVLGGLESRALRSMEKQKPMDGIAGRLPGLMALPFIVMLHLLFAHLVLVLLFPSIGLCLFKLGGSEALFLAVLDTEIFFLGLVIHRNRGRMAHRLSTRSDSLSKDQADMGHEM